MCFIYIREVSSLMSTLVQVKLVLQHNRFYVESRDQDILKSLLRDHAIREAHMKSESGGTFAVSKGLREKVCMAIV